MLTTRCNFWSWLPLFLMVLTQAPSTCSWLLLPKSNWSTEELISGFVSELASASGCTLVIAEDQPLRTRDALFRTRHLFFSPTIAIRLQQQQTIVETTEASEPNATLAPKPIWPKNPEAIPVMANCVLFALAFRKERFQPLMELLSSKVVLRPSEDRYVLWATDAPNAHQEMLSSYGSTLKFKVALSQEVAGQESNALSLWTVCFFCDGGEPLVIELGQHRKLHLHGPEAVFPDLSRNMHGKFMRGVFLRSFSPEGIREKRLKPDMAVMPSEVITQIIGHTLNFRWTVETMAVGDAAALETQLEDGTWLGMVGEVLYGRAGFCPGTAQSERALSVVDYTVPYFFDHVGFVTANPRLLFSWKVMVQPYAWAVWAGVLLALLLCTVAMTLLLCLQAAIPGAEAFQPLRQSAATSYAFLFLATALIGQSVGRLPSPLPLRVFMLFWWLFATVITCGYTSKLVSFMTLPEKEVLPENLQDLLRMDYLCAAPYKHGVFYHMLVENVDVETYHQIEHRMGSMADMDECLEETYETRGFACMSLRMYLSLGSLLKLDSRGEQVLRLAPEAALAVHVGFMLPKHHVATAAFSAVTRRVMESGILEPKTYREIFRATRLQGLKLPPKARSGHGSAGDGPTSLTWKHVQGPFFAHAIGLALSLGAFLAEKACSVHAHRRQGHVHATLDP